MQLQLVAESRLDEPRVKTVWRELVAHAGHRDLSVFELDAVSMANDQRRVRLVHRSMHRAPRINLAHVDISPEAKRLFHLCAEVLRRSVTTDSPAREAA